MDKKRKKGILGRYLVIISSIIALITMGMTYAYWTDQLHINTSISTGSIEPVFCKENYWINIVRDGGPVPSWDDDKTDKWVNESPKDSTGQNRSRLDINIRDGGQTLEITGELEEGYKAFIHYCVINNGSVPIKYIQDESKKDQHEDLKLQDGLFVQVEQPSEVLAPLDEQFTDHSNGDPKILVQVPKEPSGQVKSNENSDDPVHIFEISLPFKQWNLDNFLNGGWQKDLKIIGNITVIKPTDTEGTTEPSSQLEQDIKEPVNVTEQTTGQSVQIP